ncbi:MAG: cupin domain-containing protein, partial [Ignavibacteriaceae bacterium]|nr:cupin domain-containing protein [Ignavibacteriaceae bacterium]
YKSERCFSTSIYFLLAGEQFSAFHKLQSDETWHFYEGSPLEIFIIDEESNLSVPKLGRDLENDETLQLTIGKGKWFAARIIDQKSFSLIGCTVTPGFNFEDFELGKRDELLSQFPNHSVIISQLTHD